MLTSSCVKQQTVHPIPLTVYREGTAALEERERNAKKRRGDGMERGGERKISKETERDTREKEDERARGRDGEMGGRWKAGERETKRMRGREGEGGGERDVLHGSGCLRRGHCAVSGDFFACFWLWKPVNHEWVWGLFQHTAV